MINLSNPIELLPPYYKDNDTYKNIEGKGILERFLEVLGWEFTRTSGEIKLLLDRVIEVGIMEPELLNLIWEYYGSVPFGHGCLVNFNPNGSYYTSNDIIPPRPVDPRSLLVYTLSLYKIRGTLDFYPALLNLYGYSSLVRDPTGDYVVPQSSISSGVYIPRYDSSDVRYDSNVSYDQSLVGLTCIRILIAIEVPPEFKTDAKFKSRMYALLNHFRPVYIYPFDHTNVIFVEDITEPLQSGFTYEFNFNLS